MGPSLQSIEILSVGGVNIGRWSVRIRYSKIELDHVQENFSEILAIQGSTYVFGGLGFFIEFVFLSPLVSIYNLQLLPS